MIIFAAVYLIMGIALIASPDGMSKILGIVVGLIAMALGAFVMTEYFRYQRLSSILASELFSGAILILIGFICIIKNSELLAYAPIIFAVMIIASGVMKMQTAINTQVLGFDNWWIMVMLALVSVAATVLVIVRPALIDNRFMIFTGIFFIYEAASDAFSLYLGEKYYEALKADPELAKKGQVRAEEFAERAFFNSVKAEEEAEAAGAEGAEGAAGASAEGVPAEGDAEALQGEAALAAGAVAVGSVAALQGEGLWRQALWQSELRQLFRAKALRWMQTEYRSRVKAFRWMQTEFRSRAKALRWMQTEYRSGAKALRWMQTEFRSGAKALRQTEVQRRSRVKALRQMKMQRILRRELFLQQALLQSELWRSEVRWLLRMKMLRQTQMRRLLRLKVLRKPILQRLSRRKLYRNSRLWTGLLLLRHLMLSVQAIRRPLNRFIATLMQKHRRLITVIRMVRTQENPVMPPLLRMAVRTTAA